MLWRNAPSTVLPGVEDVTSPEERAAIVGGHAVTAGFAKGSLDFAIPGKFAPLLLAQALRAPPPSGSDQSVTGFCAYFSVR
jgi:hypothetical protein